MEPNITVSFKSLRFLVALPILLGCLHAHSILNCRDLVANSSLVAVERNVSIAGSSSEGLISLAETSDPLILALKKEFLAHPSAEDAISLMKAGVSRAEVVAFITPTVQRGLEFLQGTVARKSLMEPARKALSSSSVNFSKVGHKLTREEFISRYELNERHLDATEVLDFWESYTVGKKINAKEMLRLAALTQDSKLMRQALEEAYFQNLHQEVLEVSVAAGNNEFLMHFAELTFVEYFLLNRKHILTYGINALREVTGPLKVRSQIMLYDLFEMLIDSEPETAIYALKASLVLNFRSHRDSISFHYIMQPSTSEEYRSRVKNLVHRLRDPQFLVEVGTWPVLESVLLTGDRNIAIETANHLFDVTRTMKTPWENDSRKNKNHKFHTMSLALGLHLGLGTRQDLEIFLQKLAMTIPQMDLTNYPSPSSFVESLCAFYSPTLFYFSLQRMRDLDLWANLNKDHKDSTRRIMSLAFLNFTKSFAERELTPLDPAAHTLYETSYRVAREEAVRMRAMNPLISEPARKQIRVFANGDFLAGNLWSAFQRFGSIQDLKGLSLVYEAMMKYGRPVDAVYVAYAMKALEQNARDISNKLSASSMLRLKNE